MTEILLHYMSLEFFQQFWYLFQVLFLFMWLCIGIRWVVSGIRKDKVDLEKEKGVTFVAKANTQEQQKQSAKGGDYTKPGSY